MTGQKGKFCELDEGMTGVVRFGDGSTVQIKGKGSVELHCKNGETRYLREVYYIPSLCNNIISLGQLSEDGNKVVLQDYFLWVRDNHRNLLMKVKRTPNRLYKIEIDSGNFVESGGNDIVCMLSKIEQDSWLWHSRLGHVNFAALTLMSKEEMACGLPKLVHPKKTCEGCLMSKQTRTPFPSQTMFSAKHVLELIHGDICGPFTPPTSAGNKFFLLLVDDCSRFMWVYLLKTKDEAFEIFKRFRKMVEKDLKQEIKVLRTDRGGEFCSNDFRNYCEESGIQRHYTTLYSPQQNGVVERRNRTIVAMVRSFLKEKGMPTTFWGEAVRHFVYILNRLPTRAVTGKTPYEALKGEKPHLHHVKVFGCIAHMKVPGAQTKKLDDRSKTVIYLGSEPGTKAHRLYDPNSGVIQVSRDVVFEEDKSWSWELVSQEGMRNLMC